MVHSTYHWPDGDDLAKVQLIIIDLCNKYGCHGLVQSCPVHIDSGTHGEDKADDAPVNVVVLQEALEGNRQRGGAEEDRDEGRELSNVM